MSLNPRSPSKREQRFSREGFQPIQNHDLENDNMAGRDATIDIPLEAVPSNGVPPGVQTNSSFAPLTQSSTNQTGTSKKHHRFIGRRRQRESLLQPAAGGKTGYDGEVDQVNTMGKIYKRIMDFSIITRYLVYVAPLALCIAIPIIVGATVAQGAKIGGVRIVWFFTWIEIIWLSIWVSKIVARFLPVVFQVLVGVVNSGIRKYSLVIRALEVPLSLVGWAVTSLATFMPIMTRNPSQDDNASKEWENIVQKILAAAVVASLIFLGEKLIIQLISINYHRKQFNARIKESKRNVYLLGQLYDASRNMFPAYCNEFAEEDFIIADSINLSMGLGSSSKGRSHARSGSQTPMRFMQNMGRVGDKLTSAFGNVASEMVGREMFNSNSSHAITTQALEKKRSAEALAKRLWMSFVVEGHDALYMEDLYDVLGENRKVEAEEIMVALDGDANGDISLQEMILKVTEMSRERKAISSSMHDVDQAITVLDRLLITVVTIAIVFVFVAFLNANFVTTLATAGTALLSLSFVFAATAQEVLGSCIFLFVKHPYDIGDRVDIGVDQYTVEHISLLFTVFRRANGSKCGALSQIPNIVLNSQNIENLSRSNAMMEEYSVFVSFDTTFEDIQILRVELNKFVSASDNSRDFQPDVNIEILGTTDLGRLEVQVQIKHKGSWANETLRAARRSKFMLALVSALKAVPINGPGGGCDAAGSAANPSYSVAITDAEAKKNSEAAEEAREQARLIPNKKIQEAMNSLSPVSSRTGAAGLSRRENKVIDDLTARDPASDPARDEAWASGRDDSSTLGRPSVDQRDIEDVRGLLRRESTRGKRKASNDPRGGYGGPSVPTISEPYNVESADYAQPSSTGGGYSIYPSQTAYNPQRQPTQRQPSSYSQALPTIDTANSPIEMSQIGAGQGNARSQSNVGRVPSNPYRQRSESVSRKPLSPPPRRGGQDNDGEDENVRPYSGV